MLKRSETVAMKTGKKIGRSTNRQGFTNKQATLMLVWEKQLKGEVGLWNYREWEVVILRCDEHEPTLRFCFISLQHRACTLGEMRHRTKQTDVFCYDSVFLYIATGEHLPVNMCARLCVCVCVSNINGRQSYRAIYIN